MMSRTPATADTPISMKANIMTTTESTIPKVAAGNQASTLSEPYFHKFGLKFTIYRLFFEFAFVFL